MLRPALLSPAFPSGMVTLHLVSSEKRRAIENKYTLARVFSCKIWIVLAVVVFKGDNPLFPIGNTSPFILLFDTFEVGTHLTGIVESNTHDRVGQLYQFYEGMNNKLPIEWLHIIPIPGFEILQYAHIHVGEMQVLW